MQHLKLLHVSGSEPGDMVGAEASRGVVLPAAGRPPLPSKQVLHLSWRRNIVPMPAPFCLGSALLCRLLPATQVCVRKFKQGVCLNSPEPLPKPPSPVSVEATS